MEDIARLHPADPNNLAFVTQTTLSVDDTQDMVEALKARFPSIVGPHKEDICYATTNRQGAVKRVAPMVDAMIVVGSPNSSNSQRLREVAEREGCPVVGLILRAGDIDWSLFGGIRRLGITAGASAPEILVEEIIDAFAERYVVSVESVSTADESVFFPLPRELRSTRPVKSGSLYGSPRRGALSLPRLRHRHRPLLQGHRRGRGEHELLSPHHRRTYILTLYEKRVREADLPFFLALMQHLARRA